MALGREQLAWTDSVWKALDDALHDEYHRTAVGLKFIPYRAQPDNAVNAPADVIDATTMTIDEANVTALVELGVNFGLSRQQLAREAEDGAGLTAAPPAAN